MYSSYDIIIAGGGPIGAATAYALAYREHGRRIAVLTEEGANGAPRTATYRFSGGSVRTWWTSLQLREMTEKTARLIETFTQQDIDIGAVPDRYVMVHRGLEVPSWNIASSKLVAHLLSKAEAGGIDIFRSARIEAMADMDMEGEVRIETPQGAFGARKVLLALGSQIKKFLPDSPFDYAKRELLVFDLPIIEERKSFPHVIIPLGEGLVFAFVKNIGGAPKLVLGQEDIAQFSDTWEPEDFLPVLVDRGLYKLMPFLEGARVEQVLWGFDSSRKTPEFYDAGPRILAATCGSAVRSCAWIGEEAASRLLA